MRASWAIWGGPIPSHESVGVDSPPWLGQRKVLTEGQRYAVLASRMEEEAMGQGMRNPLEAGKDKATESPTASERNAALRSLDLSQLDPIRPPTYRAVDVTCVLF